MYFGIILLQLNVKHGFIVLLCAYREREKEKENKNALSFSNKYSITYEMACIAHSHTMEPDWAK